MLELKEMYYPGPFPPDTQSKVAYLVLGNLVYFSGLSHGFGRRSTINYAEQIIELLCYIEGLYPFDCQFFDVQTYRGYPSKKPGEWEIDRLEILELNPKDEEKESKGPVIGIETGEYSFVSPKPALTGVYSFKVENWISVDPEVLGPKVLALFKPLIFGEEACFLEDDRNWEFFLELVFPSIGLFEVPEDELSEGCWTNRQIAEPYRGNPLRLLQILDMFNYDLETELKRYHLTLMVRLENGI